ncbi:hypothetical protein BS47DRAFT_1368105 [Hydnum rufescens UP504]|uniref:Uncharacterized protein n=1 Tax=Hydnum rufescens UP504 TaxID=1448309 RepID=A0A9P6AGX2_9AGAM|nr:hypothetical protein BS47DRAFT_1368105 [Hydnum rufescens UP504]
MADQAADEEYLAAPQIHSLSCIIISSITRLGVTPSTLRDTGFPLRHHGPSSNPGARLGIFQCSRQVCIFFIGLGRGLRGINGACFLRDSRLGANLGWSFGAIFRSQGLGTSGIRMMRVKGGELWGDFRFW